MPVTMSKNHNVDILVSCSILPNVDNMVYDALRAEEVFTHFASFGDKGSMAMAARDLNYALCRLCTKLSWSYARTSNSGGQVQDPDPHSTNEKVSVLVDQKTVVLPSCHKNLREPWPTENHPWTVTRTKDIHCKNHTNLVNFQKKELKTAGTIYSSICFLWRRTLLQQR